MAQAPKQASFSDLLTQMNTLRDQLNSQAQERVDAIKAELDEIAEVTGKSVAELLGMNTRASSNTTAPVSGRKGSAIDDETKGIIERIRQEYAGMMLLHPEDSGKDYGPVGEQRGRFPTIFIQAYKDGKIKAKSVDDYKN